MSEVRDDRQYTETHEWILDNGDGTYTMGISVIRRHGLC